MCGNDLHAHLHRSFVAFPDVSFDIVNVASMDEVLAVERLMRGTNRGPLVPGFRPTGASVALPGVDVITLDGNAIASVRGFFDQQLLRSQLGLQVLAQPASAGPQKFGRAVWLTTGSRARLGAFSTTWIDVLGDADQDEVVARSRQMMLELASWPCFIGGVFTNVAGRLSMQVAWDSVETAHRVLQMPAHREALRRFFDGRLGVAVHTSVWAPARQNALWVLCPTRGKVEAYEAGGQSVCGAPFAEPPSYW